MSKFFIESPIETIYTITGLDAIHISKSLRMKCGDKITLCYDGLDYETIITNISTNEVTVEKVSAVVNASEPDVEVTLYQGVPKSDKMDLIIQKSVELGVSKVVPVLMHRCVSRPDKKAYSKKTDRWQKIAQGAAQQSRRGKIPIVMPFITFNEAIEKIKDCDCNILFYEDGGTPISNILESNPKKINIFIGPEGGVENNEVECFIKNGGTIGTLGKRILRTETASLVALSVIMYQTGNL